MTTFSTLYEFNGAGLEVFKKVFEGQIEATVLNPESPDMVDQVEGTEEFTIGEYGTTKEMAESVLVAIGKADIARLVGNTGLWAWLTFVMRDQLFKKTRDGIWKIGDVHRWYPSNLNDWQQSLRHLVRMPVLLLESLDADADHLLCGHPSILPEIREQLTSHQDMCNKEFQKVARMLYYDEVRGSLKRGAGGQGPGSPRRFAQVRQQLDVTWDLEHLKPRQILEMLPTEFEKFKPKSDGVRTYCGNQETQI